MARTYCVLDTQITPLETIDLAQTCVTSLDDVRKSKNGRLAILKLEGDFPAFTDGHMLFTETGIRAYLVERANDW